jgi:hypothetical protein
MGYFDEATGMALLIIILVVVVGYIIYMLAVGASYVLVAVLGVLYTALAIIGSLLLAGLDMLLCPAQLAAIPWAAWAAWGGLAGAAAGFWTVAPVYGMRRLRPALLLFTPVAMLAVLALRLVFGPAAPAPAAQAAAPAPNTPSAPQQWINYDIPLRFEGLIRPDDPSKPQQIGIALGDEHLSCSDISTGPPVDQPQAQDNYNNNYYYLQPEQTEIPRFIGVQLSKFCKQPYNGELPITVRIQPSLSGAAGGNTYWTQSIERGGYLIWFLDRTAAHVLFTLVVEPKGDYRFIDGAAAGTGALDNGARDYIIARHSGVLGMSRNRQHVKVDWRPAGFRRDDGQAVSKYGIGFGNLTFPEGELVIDITPQALPVVRQNGSTTSPAPGA